MPLGLSIGLAIGLALGLMATAGAEPKPAAKKMAVTTTSPEARRLFVEGLDLLERRRHTDAYARCREAVAKDPGFAVAHLCLHITAGSRTESLEELRRAVSLADQVTEAERLWILSDDAIVRGDAVTEKSTIDRLVALVPDDERAYNLLAAYHYRHRDYPSAIEAYLKTVKIAPSYTLAYNQLGYCYEFLGRYAEAEAAFKKYIEVLPDDPNPYDSHAELLMKMGKYAGSIQQYEKALAIDRTFASAYVGIGNNQIFLGRGGDARKTFARLAAAGRTPEEKRRGWQWTAVSYVHEGRAAEAVQAMTKASAIADAAGDLAGLAADVHFIGEILLETGSADEATARFERQAATLGRASAPAEVKAAARRDARFDRGRVALVKSDAAAARTEHEALLRDATEAKAPASLFRAHELAGRIALAANHFTAAATALEQADPRDPRARYLLGVAVEGKGDTAKARKIFDEVVDWNTIHPDLGFVRTRAMAAAQRLGRPAAPRPRDRSPALDHQPR